MANATGHGINYDPRTGQTRAEIHNLHRTGLGVARTSLPDEVRLLPASETSLAPSLSKTIHRLYPVLMSYFLFLDDFLRIEIAAADPVKKTLIYIN